MPRPHTRLVAFPCKISRGVVTDERGFEIRLSDGEIYSGVAPAYYFWDDQNEPLSGDPPQGDSEVSGKIAARVIERGDDITLISIPDGSVVEVKTESVVAPRPTEVIIHVPVGS